MSTPFLQIIVITAAVVLVTALGANAADPIPSTDAATQPPDKWRFTVFNPTPVEQLRDMDTDRPNKTNTPHTIDAGHLQLETGIVDYSYYRDKDHGANIRSDAFALGQFNFRLGVLNNLELNAVINAEDVSRSTNYTAQQSSRQNGFGDTTLGAKLNLWGNDSGDEIWASSLGIQPQFKIPTARENLGNGHPELFVGVPFYINLPQSFHLGLQPTVSWERNTTNDGEVTGWQNAASVDRVFFKNFDFYLEYWAHISTERHRKAEQTIDVGVVVTLNENLTLDSGVNFGLNKATTTLECLVGVSLRF